MRWFLLLAVVACGPEEKPPGQTHADTDTDTDTDTDSDTDTDTEAKTDTGVPLGPEICLNGYDDDGDGEWDCLDADCAPLCDADGDGTWGVQVGGLDCADGDPSVHPGALEVCDAVDNDCDGLYDADDPEWDAVAEGVLVFLDADLDGYGALEVARCGPSLGYSDLGGDCDELDASVNPGGVEVCGARDEDCDLLVDDEDPSVDPASLQLFWTDGDGDTYGDPAQPSPACRLPAGSVINDGDCDDADPDAYPGQSWLADADGDGYGVAIGVSCLPPVVGAIPAGGVEDCDDAVASVHPDAPEVCWDGTDQDCNLVDDCHPALLGDSAAWELAVTLPLGNDLGLAVAQWDAEADGVPDLVVTGAGGAWLLSGPAIEGAFAPGDLGTLLPGVGVVAAGSGVGGAVVGDPAAAGGAGAVWILDDGTGLPGMIPTLDGVAGDGLGASVARADFGAVGTARDAVVVGGPGGGDRWIATTGDAGWMGHRVVAGDLDADGSDDVVVGAPGGGAVGQGEVRVFFARPAGVGAEVDADVVLQGLAGDGIGTGLAVGDVDDDGAADLVVGSVLRGITGTFWVFLGPLGAGDTLGSAVLEVGGPDAARPLGGFAVVSPALDGSATPWILAGGSSRVLAVPGDTSGVVAPSAAGTFEFRPAALPTGAATGDLDGDGYPDVALGMPFGLVDSGVRVLFGSPL